MVAPSDVPRGLACHCFCPKCGAALVARQGERNIHHFAHYTASDCQGAVETALHRFAKQVICDERRIALPAAFVELPGCPPERIMWPYRWDYTAAEAEPRIADIRPDVMISKPPFARIAIEILVAHQVEPAKIARLAELEVDAVEIDLSHVNREIGAGALRDQVLMTAPRAWLFSRILHRAQIERERLFRRGEYPPS